MRSNSLPPTSRAAGPHHGCDGFEQGRPPLRERRPGPSIVARLRNGLLTVPIALLPLLGIDAGTPHLAVAGDAYPGATVTVTGSGFRDGDAVQLYWGDGDVEMLAPVAEAGGAFSLSVAIPAAFKAGPHELNAVAFPRAGVARPQPQGTHWEATVIVDVRWREPGRPVRDFGFSRLAPTTMPPLGGDTEGERGQDDQVVMRVPPPDAPAASASDVPVAVPSEVPVAAPPDDLGAGANTPAASVAAAPTPASAAAPPPAPATTAAPTPTPSASLPALPGAVAGALYVAPDGNDRNSGSATEPFRSVARGMSALEPGQTLYLRGGTYVENVENPSVNAGDPRGRITVANYPGERPVIQGLLWVSGASYWTFSGINVTWWDANGANQHMVKITNGVGWAFTNAEIWGARAYSGLLVVGTVSGQPADWVVSGNCIHDTLPSNGINQDHNMYINTGLSAGAGVVEHNLFFNAPNGENIKLGGPDSASYDGSANVTIWHNTLHSASQPMLLGGGTRNILIEGNIVGGSSSGHLVRGYQLTGANNVYRNNLGYGANRILNNDGSSSGVVDGGGNLFPYDPLFDTVGCGGLNPQDVPAQAYGR